MIFLLRRLAQGALVMLVVALVAFLMFRFMGDPVRGMLREDATLQEQQELRDRLGLDRPLVVQFAKFVGGALQGEFGVSWRNQQPVMELILDRLPATIELVVVAMIIALLLGVPLGVWSALNRHRPQASLLQTVSLIGISTPTFVTGILLILVFAVILGWLPSFGRGETVEIGFWRTGYLTASGWKALILPACTLALYQLALFMRLVRAEMLDVMRQDFVRFARARGLPTRLVRFRHALRNALMPLVTIAGMQVGSLIAFAIVTETVFQWPGMGFLFLQAVQFVDIPVMAAYLVFIGFIFVVLNIAVDVLYTLIDPRLRTGGAGAGR
ncbi:ABC transporter permease (plasmid) [Geminicoccaceae bacterium 1502E]|uniref:ABC transporter permease n=1 Tax=Marinimicrococcus flavescens TaxID=3031815 RepID=A0AAP3UY54_9PROT|nr:ABC transporter permease [Marinimicrococcus flavescens]MDX6750173.1 ABC transporter permease [Geminicoccaceae bacterium 1502E]